MLDFLGTLSYNKQARYGARHLTPNVPCKLNNVNMNKHLGQF